MRYKDLTEEQVSELVLRHYRFTTKELSVEDAINLFLPLSDGSFFKTSVLLECVIPSEYLSDKKFMRALILLRPYIRGYRSVFSYADTSLKNDREMVDFAIDEHKEGAIDALISYVELEDKEGRAKANRDPNVYIEPVDSEIGNVLEVVRYKVCSNLLDDREFLKDNLKKAREEGYSQIAHALAEHSSTLAIDDELASIAVAIDPSVLFHVNYLLFQDSKFVKTAIKSIVESGRYDSIRTIDTQYQENDSKIRRLINICKRLSKLPEDAKLRNKLYEKLAKMYLKKLNVGEVSQGV